MRLTSALILIVLSPLAAGPVDAQAPSGAQVEVAADAPFPQARPSPTAIANALGRHHREGDLQRIIQAALRIAQLEPERARAAARRARRSGWLPTLRFAVRHGQGTDLLERQTSEEGRTDVSTDADLTLSGSLTFDLGSIAFSRHEVPLLREERSLRVDRRLIVETVARLYFERLRLILERDLVGPWPVETAIRAAELKALLNAFTDGAFTRIIGERRDHD